MTKKLKKVEPKVKNKPLVKEENKGALIRQQIIEVANDTGKLPAEVTKADYYASDVVEMPISDWEFRKLGGFETMKKTFFPPEKNPVVGEATKAVRQYRNQVNAQIGREIFLADEIVAVLKEVLKANPLKVHAPAKPVKKSGNKGQKRVLVAHLSDLHYGTNVSKEEMDSINELNSTIAARRTALMMDQIVTYKPQY